MTPPSDRTGRLGFLELGDGTPPAGLADALLPQLDELLAEWHGFLRTHPATAALLGPPGSVGHLREGQRAHFRSLVAAPIDAEYLAERARVGRVHHRVGLAPFWYLGAYRKFLALARARLDRVAEDPATAAAWADALERRVALDVALALDAYQEQEQQALRRSNRELERQMARARESGRLKEAFLARISHELRTPLHAMLGFADLVADGLQGPVNPEQRASLAKVRAQGEHLVGMVDQLIEAAKLSAGVGAPAEPFDPGVLLTEAAAFARDAAAVAGLEFRAELAPELPRVRGDRRGTAVALRQLLEHAVRRTAAGTVTLRAQVAGDVLRVEVADTGAELTAEGAADLFALDHPGEPSGAGLGLALAREALQSTGGSLELAASGPAGNTFAAVLPLSPGEEP